MKTTRKKEPDLAAIGKGNPFEVPHGYFEGFSDRLQERIHTKENRISARQVVMLNWKPYLAAAVVLLVALLSGTYYMGKTQERRMDRRFHAEITQVVEQELYSIDETTLLEMLSTDVPEKLPADAVDAQDALDYLLNESLDEADLLNAL
jgi:hypothetical protein